MKLTFYYDTCDKELPELLVDSVEIFSMEENTDSKILTGKLDTGAKASVIPKQAVRELGLRPWGSITAYDYKNIGHAEPTYFVRLELVGLINKVIRVIASNRLNVLVGRDILNSLKLTANGRDRLLSLEVGK